MKTRFDSAAVPAAGDVKVLENPSMKCMVRVIRAKDLYGLWSDEGDADLLAKFTTMHEQRRATPIVGDLDPPYLREAKHLLRRCRRGDRGRLKLIGVADNGDQPPGHWSGAIYNQAIDPAVVDPSQRSRVWLQYSSQVRRYGYGACQRGGRRH